MMTSNHETLDIFGTNLVMNRRKERLKRQFHLKLEYKVDLKNLKNPRHSLERLFSFIYEYTDICNVESIKTETLFEYLQYHHLENFNNISFTQAVKDINRFLGIRNSRIAGSELKIDLSVQNYNLWTRV